MNEITEAIQAVPVARKRKITIRRILAYCAAAIIAVAVAAQLAYTFSGSGTWQYLGTSNGVAIYSMKIPGDNWLKFKGIFYMKTTLDRVVAFTEDPVSGDIAVDFYKTRIIGPFDTKSFLSEWRSGSPGPFKPRDYVARNTFTQDPKTGAVLFTLTAMPNAVPKDSCCVRIPFMHNSWLFTPKGNGTLEVTWKINMRQGGFFPYLMMNFGAPLFMADFAPHLQTYANRAKYANAKFAWIHD